jgi:hypothetical protein
MEDNVVAPVNNTPETPKSIDEIIAGLRGFGIEENEEILTVQASGRVVRLRISNIPTEQEMQALLATEEYKGYAWVPRIRCEILSRAISWIDGVNVHNLEGIARLVVDPTDKDGTRRDIQIALRNIILGWGPEMVTTLWKILMVHSDRIEKRLQNTFPDSTILTDVERRFMETALKEIEDTARDVIQGTVEEIFNGEVTPEDKADLEKLKGN